MNKTFFTLCLLLIASLSAVQAGIPIVFDGDSIEKEHYNQEVTFEQTLYVCGKYSNGYGRWLYLSDQRARLAEDVAVAGTFEYDSLLSLPNDGMLWAYCPDSYTSGIRLGATFKNLTATVTDHHSITIHGELAPTDNQRPEQRPDVGDASLIICNTNLEYFCAEWEGTYGATSDELFKRQCVKTGKALANINADLYAVEEIQQGDSSLKTLTDLLNHYCGTNNYTYLNDGDTSKSVYNKVGFIYRKDKVAPVLELGKPYTHNPLYLYNEYVQAFEEISSKERFVLSVNHFASKVGDTTYACAASNKTRMSNVTHLTDFLTKQSDNDYYQDDDILIVGDLNCGTMEEPIRHLTTMGYENQMRKFSPNGYSYVYDNRVEYLDHAFASKSMAEQITGAAPYHINADENGGLYYKYSTDSSMYRYSDHDPIIIGLKLHHLASQPGTTSISETSDIRPEIFGTNGRIVIRSSKTENIRIYDLLGRERHCEYKVREKEIFLPKGIYIVQTGNFSKKVLVW